MPSRTIAMYSILFAAVIWLAGCSQCVRQTIAPVVSDSVPQDVHASVVLLPFADYSMGSSPDTALRRQIKLNEALIYNLAKNGFYGPLEEDVVQYLIDRGVIKVVGKHSVERPGSTLVLNELSGWSGRMQEEVKRLVLLNETRLASQQKLDFEKVGLTKEIVQEIGERFSSDYLLRGRIVEYEIRKGHTLNPFQRGMLPFFFDFTSNAVFGVAKSEKYDLWQDMTVGAALGAAFGASARTPFNAPRKETHIEGDHPRFATAVTEEVGGYSSHHAYNAAFWGAAGASAAYLASKGGKVPQAVLQISLALQDAKTGKVVWANRAEKQVMPETMWADPKHRTQMDRAIEEVTKALVEDLATTIGRMSMKAEATSERRIINPVYEEPTYDKKIEKGASSSTKSTKEPVRWGS